VSVTALTRLLDHGLADRGGAAAARMLGRAGGRTVGTGVDHVFPLSEQLRHLLPWDGLRRGATVAVTFEAPGATSVLLSLIAEPVRAGSWCAVVGVPALGAVAAAESGIDLARFAMVPDPGSEWATVTAALLDGLDIVVVRPSGPVAPRLARRLTARARQRGSVLVPCGVWDGADVVLRTTDQVWHGLGSGGGGRLRGRELTLVANGRGAAARPRKASIWLPAPDPGPATVADGAAPGTSDVLTLVGDPSMTEAS
jgi:hypothetical protein